MAIHRYIGRDTDVSVRPNYYIKGARTHTHTDTCSRQRRANTRNRVSFDSQVCVEMFLWTIARVEVDICWINSKMSAYALPVASCVPSLSLAHEMYTNARDTSSSRFVNIQQTFYIIYHLCEVVLMRMMTIGRVISYYLHAHHLRETKMLPSHRIGRWLDIRSINPSRRFFISIELCTHSGIQPSILWEKIYFHELFFSS